jgi:hypothetical protein
MTPARRGPGADIFEATTMARAMAAAAEAMQVMPRASATTVKSRDFFWFGNGTSEAAGGDAIVILMVCRLDKQQCLYIYIYIYIYIYSC